MTKIQCVNCSKLFTDEDALARHRRNEHPHQAPSDTELDIAARHVLWEFLTSDGTDRGLLAKAKQANTYRSTEARREQTQSAREATLVMMARELAEDKKQFRDFIRLALPHAPMLQIAKGADKSN